jgi:hypothetical protein
MSKSKNRFVRRNVERKRKKRRKKRRKRRRRMKRKSFCRVRRKGRGWVGKI